MKDCPFKKYCGEDCGQCTEQDKAKKIECVAEALQPIIAHILEVLAPVVKEMTQTITRCVKAVIECYPNRRVVHLALCHPKARIRRKNLNRIMRWLNNTKREREEE